MRKKWMLLFLAVFVLFLNAPAVNIVNADDDHEKDKRKEYDRDWDDDDDDDWEEDYEDYGADPAYQTNQLSNWNIWTRETNISGSEKLPFQQAQEVNLRFNNETKKIYIIPQNSQLLVSGEKMAQLLQADYKFYPQSRILEVSKGKDQLIVRAGSNASYENMIKTPMPTKGYFFEKSLYLPISVMANALGYRLNWDENSETIIIEEIL